MSRDVHLAEDPDRPGLLIDQVVHVVAVAVGGELGVAEGKPHAQAGCLVPERLRIPVRHLRLVEVVGFLERNVPAREEGGEGQFGEGDHRGSTFGRLAQQGDEAFNDVVTRMVALDRTELACCQCQDPTHRSAFSARGTSTTEP